MLEPQTLGRGWAFPLRLDERGNKPLFTQDEQRVMESITSIIRTNIGERPHLMRNGIPYGTRFQELLFSSADAAVDMAVFDAKVALHTWEPRITILDVKAYKHYDQLAEMYGVIVNIAFRYRATGRVDSWQDLFKAGEEGP
jgi:phage baseplate assembly protein W